MWVVSGCWGFKQLSKGGFKVRAQTGDRRDGRGGDGLLLHRHFDGTGRGPADRFQSMVGGGMPLDRAAALSGLMVPDDAA